MGRPGEADAHLEARRRVAAQRQAEGLMEQQEAMHRAHMKAYADEEQRAAAANGGDSPVFATGTLDPRIPATLRLHPTRQLDDAPDPAHSPELIEGEPDYSITDLMGEQFGLDEHGNPLPADRISEAQRRARADRYAGVDQEPLPDVTLSDGTSPTLPASTTNRVHLAGD